jgi:Flp pilus assembly pilin Flp
MERIMTSIALALFARMAAVRNRSESGQTLAEYSLIITAIAVGLVLLAMLVFRDALADAFNAATACLDGSC